MYLQNCRKLFYQICPDFIFRENVCTMDHRRSSSSETGSSATSDETQKRKKLKKIGNSKNNKLHLTLDNFDSDDVPSDYPYVLTSPRSLAACKHFGVRVR